MSNHTYAYAAPSGMWQTKAGQTLGLATSGGVTEKPCESSSPTFFHGSLLYPRATAVALETLSQIVTARFTMTPSEREAMKDPVVTSGGGLLRFEGFSGCCGLYARLDLTPESYDGLVANHGTTNVDFGSQMRQAIRNIRDRDAVGFAVGHDGVDLVQDTGVVHERKVPLPVRWLKGFLEASTFQGRMKPVFKVGRPATIQFLRGLRQTMKLKVCWVKPAGSILRISQTRGAGAVQAGGLGRLHLLKDLAPVVQGLTVYAEESGETSTWEFNLPGQRFSVVISPETYRGFSGEGQALHQLARPLDPEQETRLQDALTWNAVLNPAELAAVSGLQDEAVGDGMRQLATQGLLGYDLHHHAWFHRVMPFDRKRIEVLNPRLRAARKLLESGGLVWTGNEAAVRGSGVLHRVELGESPRCTCRWYTKYLGGRGPCKHILAAQLSREIT